jgi:hypothetical protein
MNGTIYMNYVMIGILLLAAVTCVAAPSADQWLPGNHKYVMALVLVAYSAVRYYRVQKFKKENRHEVRR